MRKTFALAVAAIAAAGLSLGAADAPQSAPISILVYHRFGPAVRDSMTVRTSTFASQLRYLSEHRYNVVSLRDVVASLNDHGPALPPGAVVITADDGHETVFTDMWPLIREQRLPVTLFIYPSAISNASYAMTWRQLETLRDSGLVDIESHSYWHPNFAAEKKRLTPGAYRELAQSQLCKSRTVLHDKLGVEPTFLAWPFGIFNEDLFRIARDCGYEAGFTLEARLVRTRDRIMALPRFLVTDGAVGKRFAAMLPARD